MSYTVLGVSSYLLLTFCIAKLEYDTPPWDKHKLGELWFNELLSGWIKYPFNIFYWTFKLVVKICLKINKVLDSLLK